MYGNFNFREKIELEGNTYEVVGGGSAYGRHYVDYDFGCKSCDEIEIEEVEIDKLEVTTSVEDIDVEVTDNKVLNKIEEIVQEWVKDGSVSLDYVD